VSEPKKKEQPWFSWLFRPYLRFGTWSEVRQFEVVESPTGGGHYSIDCQDLKQFDEHNRINFSLPLEYEDKFVSGISGTIHFIPAWARMCFPKSKGQMPVVLFLHGESYNCQRCSNNTASCSIEDKKENSYYHWRGKYTHENDPNALHQQILPPGQCDKQQYGEEIIESHRGFDYLLEELARHGILALSINTHELQGRNLEAPDEKGQIEDWRIKARAEVLLRFLDKLDDWNQNGTDPFDGIFKNQLDLKKVGLVGHSRGGEAAIAITELLKNKNIHVQAISAIAPTVFRFRQAYDVPYYLLQGLRDNDAFAMQPLAYYQESENSMEKMKAMVYGANHNYFNSEWVAKLPDEALDIGGANPMEASEQQGIALTTITAFMRWHLLDETKYQHFLMGRYKQERTYWAYHVGENDRLTVDDFEQVRYFNDIGKGPQENTLGGNNDFTTGNFQEKVLHYSDFHCYLGIGLEKDPHFFANTVGMRLLWLVTATQTTGVYHIEIPENTIQIDNSTHLSFLVANVAIGNESPIFSENQTSMNLAITLKTKTPGGRTKRSYTVEAQAFERVPHPYQRMWKCESILDPCTDNQQAILTGIRIPLSEFGLTPEELNNLSEIEIEVDATGNDEGNLALDEIVFTK
jgi:dienelactone hydrolase